MEKSKIWRSVTGLGLLLAVSACSNMPLDFLRPQAQGLETLSQKVGPEGSPLSFAFEFDDKADAADGEVGSGYIVVSQDGKELIAADKVADDGFLRGINFYVKGVEGKVPGDGK